MKQVDLADLDSVKRCSHDIAANEPRIDGLILNAGLMACPLMHTEQGFELQMGECKAFADGRKSAHVAIFGSVAVSITPRTSVGCDHSADNVTAPPV